MTGRAAAQPGPYDLDRQGLAEWMADGPNRSPAPSYRVDQLWEGLYANGGPPEDWTNVPKALRRRFADELPPALVEVRRSTGDGGDTTKWLWRLHDGATIETVLMVYGDRATVCVSSQAGCAMACGFCATGQDGFTRHLTVGEIVEQVIVARRASPRRLSNVVFMGMGEPLANYGPTVESLRRLRDDLGLSARHLTVSTVGMVPAIGRLAAEGLPVSLAISVHAATDDLRDELVPINRRHDLTSLVDAAVDWRERTGRRVSFEWALIDGVNDTPEQLDALISLARRARAHVNFIPLNPTPGWPTTGTSRAGVRSARDRLDRAGITVTVRDTRGDDIDAACGQLASRTRDEGAVEVASPRRRG
ncbi:MAG: 23S rRNA (adenine(2503)-C(2))-methyltransferase RlmN [Microthrixaceae bacterium]